MDKLKKTGIVSAAALIFLLIASLAAYLFGFVKTDYPNAGWVFIGAGAAILVASGVVAFAVRKYAAVNIACFAANSVALGLCIRGWYILRGLENSFLTMFLVCLACIAYLWIFFLLCLVPFLSRHIKPFFFIWLGISAVAYILVVIFTETTFVSTFGYYMLMTASFIFAMISGVSGIHGLIRAMALSSYSVVVVAAIAAVVGLTEDGDMCLDFIPDILGASPDDIGKKKAKKPGNVSPPDEMNVMK